MNFRPLYDLILVKPDPEVTKVGSVVVPAGALKAGHQAGPSEDAFTGTVVAIGPGDRHKPFRLLPCVKCGCKQKLTYLPPPAAIFKCECGHISFEENVEFWDAGRHPMLTQVGDRVVYPRRASMPGGEFELKIDGERYTLFHEEQSAYGIIEA